jgi:hypothetical protein
VDLYVGFVLFAMWMVFREKNIITAIIWVVAIMVLGFFTGALYVFYAAHQSKHDWLTFFLGDRKEDVLKKYKETNQSS